MGLGISRDLAGLIINAGGYDMEIHPRGDH
jgi:hypothetical protein